MTHNATRKQSTYLNLRISRQLEAELRAAAERRASNPSATARQLIAWGLSLEMKARELATGGESPGPAMTPERMRHADAE